jgi:hypothetical protein
MKFLFLQAAYPNDWLNVPVLVFETATMVQTNSMAELNEIEKWGELVYPAFDPFLFELNLPAFQPLKLVPVPVPVPVPVRIPFQLVLLFQLSHLFLVLVPFPQKNFSSNF